MIDDIKEDAAGRMAKSVESLGEHLAKVRTGRAHPSLLDHLTVSYYGAEVPLTQVANVGVEDARTITVQPYEQQMVLSLIHISEPTRPRLVSRMPSSA